jgi:hypothetical protein
VNAKTSSIVGVGIAAVVAGGLLAQSLLASEPATAALPQSDVNTQAVTTALAEAEAEAKAKAEAERKAREEAERKAREEAERKAREEAERQAAAAAAAAEQQSSQSSGGGSATNDYGIAGSAYTGSYYNSAYENTRKCIVRKESGGNYGVVSSNGLWHGAYQFTRGTGDAAARQMGRGDLVGIPANQWSRADQDQAFWTIWNHGAGRHNWPTANGC